MGKTYERIDDELQGWIAQQKMFFVATAPLSQDGHVNCSPKGLDTFTILGPRSAGYVDFVGSGIETIAHLKENGRIVIMFCAFEGPPMIARLHGIGRAMFPGTAEFEQLAATFTDCRGARSIIQMDVTRISTSCGSGVPLYEYQGQRETLLHWTDKQGPDKLLEYQKKKNAVSIDGLAGIEL